MLSRCFTITKNRRPHNNEQTQSTQIQLCFLLNRYGANEVIGPPDVYPETGDKAGSWCIAANGVGHFVEVKQFHYLVYPRMFNNTAVQTIGLHRSVINLYLNNYVLSIIRIGFPLIRYDFNLK